ncbi:rootletin [Cloeon dipterum]|uniref:rootletin n=1 Tax=Cloeon dipterum TaxID=197152 RepID=UPI00321FC2AB
MGCHGEWSVLLAGVAARSRAPLCEPPRSDANLLWLLHKQAEPRAGHNPIFELHNEPLVHPADQPSEMARQVSIREPHDLSSQYRPTMDQRRPGGSYPLRPATKGAMRPPPRGGADPEGVDGGVDTLHRENQSLKRRLDEESANYRRRLDTYKQAQQHQAALVSRLQAKVLQYKQKCSDLETQALENVPDSDLGLRGYSGPKSLDSSQHYLSASTGDVRDETIHDLDSALRRLEEEKRKNMRLREQLEESYLSNDTLSSDLQKLTTDWEHLRDELIIKEDEWKEEEQTFNEYYSAEHNRLLNLWRDVMSMKRAFVEVRSTTEQDLTKLRAELTNSTHEMSSACQNLANYYDRSSRSDESTQRQQEQEIAHLRGEIMKMQSMYDSAQAEICSKDDQIQALLHDMKILEEKCDNAEQGAALVQRAQEELALLQNALRDIAHAVLQDAENKNADANVQPASHLHLSVSHMPPRTSPKGQILRAPTSPAFAESTISAVQAALHKHQLLAHELHNKLKSAQDQLLLFRRQCEVSDENGQALENHIMDLTQQLDSTKALANQLGQEKESLQKNVENLRSDKNKLERNLIELKGKMDSLNSDLEKAQKANAKLQKWAERLENDKMILRDDVERMNRDSEIREANLKAEVERCGRIREDLINAREELNKLYLAKDVLEQQKLDSESDISLLEKSKSALEMELDQALLERSDAHEALVKLDNINKSHVQDKTRQQDDIRKLLDENSNLKTQCTDHQNDIESLRKELLQAEQTRLDLESEKLSLHEKIKYGEMEKEKINIELLQVARERTELSKQIPILARQKEELNEEVQRVRQRLEQANETNARLNREMNVLVKDKEETQVLLEATEKELQRLHEQHAALRSEKEALEAVLFDAQSSLEASEVRGVTLEKEIQALLVTQESLKGQVARLQSELENTQRNLRETKSNLLQQMGGKDAEYKETMANLKKHSEETARKLTEEREQVKQSLEKRMQQAIQQLESEKEHETSQLINRIEELQAHMEALIQQHEESLLRAENDKQQALLLAHHDIQALQERLVHMKKELEEESGILERTKREAVSKAEQDRAVMNQLRDELAKIKAKFEDLKQRTEDEKNHMEARISETKKERDSAQSECDEIRVQLHLVEDRSENLQSELQETNFKLKELENLNDSLKKDLNDVRRQLAESNCEKDKYGMTNKDLREQVKRVETEKREQLRALEDSFQKISILEDSKTGLDTERTRLQLQLRDVENAALLTGQQLSTIKEEKQKLESAHSQLTQEHNELTSRLANESEEKERAQQEMHQLRKQMMELGNGLEMSRQELSRIRSRAAEEEERWRGNEQALLARIEDGRVRERKLEDQKHNIEVCLADATQQIQELKAKLGGSEGRVKALEGQLSNLEAVKKETEQRLSSVGSTLRRIAGIQLDGSVTLPYRLSSPSRRWSPARYHRSREAEEKGATEMIDVDPEVVRKGVRSLMQQVAQIERERDDFKGQVSAAQKQLKDAIDAQGKGDSRLTNAMQTIRSLQDEKSKLVSKLGQKDISIAAQTDALQQKSEELLVMRERITSLELNLQSGQEDKNQTDEKIERFRQAINRLDQDKRNLQEELARSESRGTKLELQRMSMEGDLQRLQMMIQEKDNHCQKLQDKAEAQSRTIASLEERCASLKTTIDQLNISLEQAATTDRDLRTEIKDLQRTLMDTASSSQNAGEKLKQIQKSLQNSENEKRVLVEKLESSQGAATDLRRAQSQLNEQIQRLQSELSNSELKRSSLETQLRLSSWPNNKEVAERDEEALRQLQTAQREKMEYKAKADALIDKVRQLERSLDRSKTTSRTFEGTAGHESSDLEHEHEIRELKMRIRHLENQLSDKDAEFSRSRVHQASMLDHSSELERLRSSQQQAERMLDNREQSHRQQVIKLENQIQLLREQLSQEVKRRQLYVLRSSRAGREMQQLRQALGDSLHTVAHDPSLDSMLLEHEARKLDSATSLVPDLGRGRSATPHK